MIKKEGQFYINREGGLALGIDSSNIKNCILEYNKQYNFFKRGKPYNSIFGHISFGFKETNLNFLNHFKTVENIWFWDVNLDNIEKLYNLKNLKSIGITGRRPAIDFSKLNKIEKITTDWTNKDYNFEFCENIKSFYLWHHKPKNKSFKDFNFPTYCYENFSLNWSNVENLTSLNGLKGIKNVEIHMSRNLTSLKGLEKYSDTIEQIIVTTCGKLDDYIFIKEFPKLKKAIINKEKLPII